MKVSAKKAKNEVRKDRVKERQEKSSGEKGTKAALERRANAERTRKADEVVTKQKTRQQYDDAELAGKVADARISSLKHKQLEDALFKEGMEVLRKMKAKAKVCPRPAQTGPKWPYP